MENKKPSNGQEPDENGQPDDSENSNDNEATDLPSPLNGRDKSSGTIHIDKLRSSSGDGALSFNRMIEIEKAIKEGRDEDYTAREFAQYKEESERLKKLFEPLTRRVTDQFNIVFKNLNMPAVTKNQEDALSKSSLPWIKHQTDDLFQNFATPPPMEVPRSVGLQDDVLNSIKDAKDEERKQARSQLKATQQMASIMAEQAADSKEMGDHQRKVNVASLILAGIAAGAAIIAVFLTATSLASNDPVMPTTPSPSSTTTTEEADE